jgi:hypothetical protein
MVNNSTYPSIGDVLGKCISRTVGTVGSTLGNVTSKQPSPWDKNEYKENAVNIKINI